MRHPHLSHPRLDDLHQSQQRHPKPRREFGDPVAPFKDSPRFIPPPFTNLQELKLPLHAVMPEDTIRATGRIVFHTVGDTGGVFGTEVKEAISAQMEAQVTAVDEASNPAFFYHLGDVIYFNGQSSHYNAKFYEPYQYYQPHIFAIPGNHDGDTSVRPGDEPDPESTLTGFMTNFCDIQPHQVTNWRTSMTQPYVYWTLDAPFVTIIGLYSNVDGTLDGRGMNEQKQWLQDQLQAAAPDKCLVVAVHHPPYSLDRPHGGAPTSESPWIAPSRAPDDSLTPSSRDTSIATSGLRERAAPASSRTSSPAPAATPILRSGCTSSRPIRIRTRFRRRSKRVPRTSSSTRTTTPNPGSCG